MPTYGEAKEHMDKALEAMRREFGAVRTGKASPALLASGVDFVLEGLYAMKKIGRSDERGYHATETPVRRPQREASFNDEPPMPSVGKKKYYN